MIYPWHQASWQRLVAIGERRAHAMLFAGAPGQGKRSFTESFAAHLLCEQPVAGGIPCEHCAGCRLRLSGNHPDLIRVIPAADEGEAQAVTANGKSKPSTQIVIEQVRQLRERLEVSSHQGGIRVVLIDPAEAMNRNTANALLKLLEEPPPQTVFLLVSAAPRGLLPTIRSRCQQWDFPRPDRAHTAQWLGDQTESGEALLALCGGMPVAAADLAKADGEALRARFLADVLSVPRKDPLMLAGDWDAWLRPKKGSSGAFDLARLADWMLRWMWDLTATLLGGTARYFPDRQSDLSVLADGANRAAMLDCYNTCMQIRRAVGHPLNTRLLLEDMLLRYARAVSTAGERT